MAILTVHHWESVNTGLREIMRVVRDSGEWQRRHGHLLARTELDVGLRLITAST